MRGLLKFFKLFGRGWPLASSPSDEEKLVRQAGGEKPLGMETLSMGMDGLRRLIASTSSIDGFECLRCPFCKGAQTRV